MIEAVGSPPRLARRGGDGAFGRRGEFLRRLPPRTPRSAWTLRCCCAELTLKASFHHTPRHIKSALDIIARGKINVGEFVIEEAPLTDLLDVFRHMMSHNGHLKTAILPNLEPLAG
ncbi:MAG: hypothetical protein R2748_14115 [Bryobacterales bacterium]